MKYLFLSLFLVSQSLAFAQVPANELIVNATILTEFPFLDENVDVFNASAKRVWYKYQPTEDMVLAVGALNSLNGEQVGIFISSVPDATNVSQLSTYPESSASDYFDKKIQKTLAAGNTYYVAVKREGFVTITETIDIAFNVSENEIIIFPDPNLGQLANSTLLSTNGNNDVEIVEALMHTENVNVSGPFQEENQVQDPTGLEYFFNASGLDISNNSIDAIDLSPFPKLELFWAENNELSEIDISPIPLLQDLRVSGNQLTEIDLTQNNQLKRFEFRDNQFTEIDFGSNPFELIDFANNSISTVDVSSLIDLYYLSVDGNNISEIDLTQNVNLTGLSCSYIPMTQIDLSQNLLLEDFHMLSLPITQLDLSANTQLKEIFLSRNELTEIDLTQNILLEELVIFNNSFSSFDLSQNIVLNKVTLVNVLISNLDLSNNINLRTMNLQDNYFLESINLKNGSNNQMQSWGFSANYNPNLEVICVDEITYAETTFTSLINSNPIFVDDCSILTSRNSIEGNITLDIDDDGCDSEDVKIISRKVISASDNYTSVSYSDDNGYYRSLVTDGNFSTQVELPAYFDYTPNDSMIEFTDYNNLETLDLCVTDNTQINDLNIVIIPFSGARPGFDTSYKIVYENIGSTTLSGSVTFQFDDTMQTFLEATPSEDASSFNLVTFNFTNIQPFERREINIEMNTFTPPTVNGDDVLNFTALINISEADSQPDDNQFQLAQIVVNSFDPNDKTVLQGDEITIEQLDDYLHYVVRFQNTGTASAVNVVILDQLFYLLDVNTFQPIAASHDYTTRIVNGNTVEFSFENIFLPAQQDDDAGSNGFVAFKIKPYAQFINVGDIIIGDASIYFDFNAPIITNQVSTEVVVPLNVEEESILENQIRIDPNPANEVINLKVSNSINIQSVSIFSMKGELLIQNLKSTKLNVNSLSSGIYILNIETNRGTVNKRLIKN